MLNIWCVCSVHVVDHKHGKRIPKTKLIFEQKFFIFVSVCATHFCPMISTLASTSTKPDADTKTNIEKTSLVLNQRNKGFDSVWHDLTRVLWKSIVKYCPIPNKPETFYYLFRCGWMKIVLLKTVWIFYPNWESIWLKFERSNEREEWKWWRRESLKKRKKVNDFVQPEIDMRHLSNWSNVFFYIVSVDNIITNTWTWTFKKPKRNGAKTFIQFYD